MIIVRMIKCMDNLLIKVRIIYIYRGVRVIASRILHEICLLIDEQI